MAQRGDADQLWRLQLVTDAALAHLDLDELLAELLSRIREALETDTAAILLRDYRANELVARAAVGLEEEVERGTRIPIGRGFAGRVAAEGRPVVLDDVDHADVLNPLLREKGVKSMLGVPLTAGAEIFGVLHVGTLTHRKFNESDIDLLQLVADRASLAIEHARLYRSERKARERLEQVQTVTDAALAHLGLDALLTKLLVRVHDILDVDTTSILLRDEDEDVLVERASVGTGEAVEPSIRIPIGRGFAGRVAAEGRPIVIDDVAHVELLNPALRQTGVKSLLGVPLSAEGEVVGVLHVGTLQPRGFTPEDCELLELVAERVVLAIQKARVHDELVRLDQLKSNFVAVASHELRTPATSVYGVAATLREHGDTLPAETRRELEETLWDQATRLRRLIEQLLDLSRLDAHAIPIQTRRLALRPLLSEVVIATLEGRSEHVRLNVDEDLAVVADRHALERIMSNLIANALRYGEPPVVVSAAARDRHLRITVEDEGEGVAAELVPRLFSRFERGSIGDGSGLGLAIARAYAQAHGGDLTYDDRAGGACFQLILPLRQPE